MSYSPAQVLASLLREGSDALFNVPGQSGDWPLYISSMPDNVGPKVGAVYDTTGVKHGRLMSGGELRSEGFQIKVRATTYVTAWEQIKAVADFLEAVHAEEVEMEDSTTYTIDSINQTSGIVSLGEDENRRSLFVVNGLVMFR